MDAIKELLAEVMRPIMVEAIQDAFENYKVRPSTRYYTREEVCQILRIGATSFYRRVNKGEIQILKIGGKTLVDAEKLDAAIERNELLRYKR